MGKFKTVAVYSFPAQAAVMKSKLESEGIEVVLRDEFTVAVDPFATQAIGGIKMDVYVEDYVKALGIIELHNPEDNGLTAHISCPNCNKRTVREQQDITTARNFKEQLRAMALSLLPLSKHATYKCTNCEHTF